jgi:hypothetical protein
MADSKSTAHNAKMIEIQMKAAASYLEEAKKAVRIAQDAFQNGENDVAGEMTNILTLQRILSSAIHDANWIAERWTGIRMDREKH